MNEMPTLPKNYDLIMQQLRAQKAAIVDKEPGMDKPKPLNQEISKQTLFEALGEETGIRKIVQSMFALSKESGIYFSCLDSLDLDDEQVASRYSLLLFSLIDKRWAWAH